MQSHLEVDCLDDMWVAVMQAQQLGSLVKKSEGQLSRAVC